MDIINVILEFYKSFIIIIILINLDKRYNMEMLNYIKYFDFLSINPNIYIDNNAQNRTFLGSIFSVLIMIASSCIFVLFALPVYERTGPTVLFSSFYEKFFSLKMNPETFPLAFTIYQNNGQVFAQADRIFKFRYLMTYNNFTISDSGTILKVTQEVYEAVKCREEFFGSNFYLFNSTRWRDNYCIDYSNMKNLSLINPAANGYNFSTLQLVMTTCINSTANNNNCLPQSIINTSLASYLFHIDSLDYYIDHNNYNSPLVPVLLTTNLQSTLSMYKYFYLQYKKVIYSNDDGFILDNSQNKTYFTLRDSSELNDLNFNKPFPGQISQATFRMNSRGLNDYYERSYTKIQNVFANIGGFFKAMTLFSQIFIIIYSRNDLYDKIIADCYVKVEAKTNNKNNLSKSYIEAVQLNLTSKIVKSPRKKLSNITTENLNLNTLNQSKLNLNNPKIYKNPQFFTMRYKVFSFQKLLCWKNKHDMFFIQKLKEELDVRNLIKNVHLVNFMKDHILRNSVIELNQSDLVLREIPVVNIISKNKEKTVRQNKL
jgi:hypothetical protein